MAPVVCCMKGAAWCCLRPRRWVMMCVCVLMIRASLCLSLTTVSVGLRHPRDTEAPTGASSTDHTQQHQNNAVFSSSSWHDGGDGGEVNYIQDTQEAESPWNDVRLQVSNRDVHLYPVQERHRRMTPISYSGAANAPFISRVPSPPPPSWYETGWCQRTGREESRAQLQLLGKRSLEEKKQLGLYVRKVDSVPLMMANLSQRRRGPVTGGTGRGKHIPSSWPPSPSFSRLDPLTPFPGPLLTLEPRSSNTHALLLSALPVRVPPVSPSLASHRQGGNDSSNSRQLNPLRIRPTSNTKPVALSFTPLAHPTHPNVSHVNLSEYTQHPSRPSTQQPAPRPSPQHTSEAPVDPTQLLLQNAQARPAAPGRPPSNIVARPSPVQPESLIGSSNAPAPTSVPVNNSPTGDSASASPVGLSAAQVPASQEGHDLAPSPFFSGRPQVLPQYVFTTQRPPVTPVLPATLLLTSANASRHPSTACWLLSKRQNLSQSYAQETDNTRIPQRRHGSKTFQMVEQQQQQQQQHDVTAAPQNHLQSMHVDHGDDEGHSDVHTHAPLPRPASFSHLVTSDQPPYTQQVSDLLQAALPSLNFSDPNSEGNSSSDGQDAPQPHNASESATHPSLKIPDYISQAGASGPPGMPSEFNSSTRFPPKNVLGITFSPEHLQGGEFPSTPQPLQNALSLTHHQPGHEAPPLGHPGHHDASAGLGYLPLGHAAGLSRPFVHPYHQRPYPPPPLPVPPPHSPTFLQDPYYLNFQQRFPESSQHHPALSFPGGVSAFRPSVNVPSFVKDVTSSAASAVVGSDDAVSPSTTVMRGGTLTSNNNFYHPQPGSVALGFIPPFGQSLRPRPSPPVIVDGVLNRTAVPSDVFPGSSVNVTCSRRHGCPVFILRTRPETPQRGDHHKNTHVIDEAHHKRPSGNISIACDVKEGCPTYIINTTPQPDPATANATVTTQIPAYPLLSQGDLRPKPTQMHLLQTIFNVLRLYNTSGSPHHTVGLPHPTADLPHHTVEVPHNIRNGQQPHHGNPTGEFDVALRGVNLDGFDAFIRPSGLTPSVHPPDTQHVGIQRLSVKAPASPAGSLSEQATLQARPSYQVVHVPHNTVLRQPSPLALLANSLTFQTNPIVTSEFGDQRDPTHDLLGRPGTLDLLKSKLVQGHLEALRISGLGAAPLSPLGTHTKEQASVSHAHMGLIDRPGAELQNRPDKPENGDGSSPLSLAALLNLEPLDIRNEPSQAAPDDIPDPPDSPNLRQEQLHHGDMMRRVMAAAVFGVPMTAALLGALGAPVAVMAPLGLVIPALLSMGFMDVNSNSGGFGSHFRRHHRHQQRRRHRHDSATATPRLNDDGIDKGLQYDTQTTRSERQGGAEDGVAGAIRRALQVLPQVTSRLGLDMGLGRRRRRSPEEKGTPLPPDVMEEEEEEDEEGRNLAEEAGGKSAPSLLQTDVDSLSRLRDYYKALMSNNSKSKVSIPTAEEVRAHRRHLLSIIQKLTKKNAAEANPRRDNSNDSSQGAISSPRQDVPLAPSAGISRKGDEPATHNTYSHQVTSLVGDRMAMNVSSAAAGDETDARSTLLGAPSEGIVPSGVLSGEPALPRAPIEANDKTSPQGIPNDKRGQLPLISSLWQTQGDSRLPPPAVSPDTLESAIPQASQRYDLLYGTLTASTPLPAPPAISSVSPHHFMQQQSQALALEAGFSGDLPPSLVQPALQSGLLSPHHQSSFTVFGEPSPFSDYSTLADQILRLQGFTRSPAVVMVASGDFQELGETSLPVPELLPFDDDLSAVQDVPDVQSAALTVGDTTQLTTAITNFVNNLVDAISQLLDDIQAALADNPSLAFLLLIPFLLIPFLHKGGGYHHGGYGGGGYNRRVYYVPQGRDLQEILIRRILTDLDDLSWLYEAQQLT